MDYPSEVIKKITELVFIETPQEELRRADLVVVFGSTFVDGTVDAIESLYKKGIIDSQSRVIFSGKNGSLNAGDDTPEAVRLFNKALERKLPREIFLVEDQATNCKENLQYSRTLIEEQGGFEQYNHILFVCMAFMTRRTQMSAANLGFPMDRIQYYGLVNPNLRNISKDSWWERDDSCERVLDEVVRIAKYTKTGDLTLYSD